MRRQSIRLLSRFSPRLRPVSPFTSFPRMVGPWRVRRAGLASDGRFALDRLGPELADQGAQFLRRLVNEPAIGAAQDEAGAVAALAEEGIAADLQIGIAILQRAQTGGDDPFAEIGADRR